MPILIERTAEAMTPEQATALVYVLDLQAQWENLCHPQQVSLNNDDLQARQKAYNLFQVAWRNYSAKYHKALLPEPSKYAVEPMLIWCRTLRAVFRRATRGSPIEVLAMVHRLADRIAGRLKKDVVARTRAVDLPAGVRELDVVIAWCDTLMSPTLPAQGR